MKTRLALLVLMALVPWIQKARIEPALGSHRGQEEALYVWSGDYVRRLSPGFEDLMADVYWLRTVQYYGGRQLSREKRYDLLEPLTNITTALDPRFEMAYHYGGIFLAEPWPTGAGAPDKAVALLERGALRLQAWRLRQLAAYFVFLHLNDPRRAADMLLQAAEWPRAKAEGAVPVLRSLAGDMMTHRGDRQVARRIWRTLYDQSSGQIRLNAELNLKRLDALDAVDALQAAVRNFEAAHGRLPRSLAEVAGRVPLDPSGIPFEYDHAYGTVSVAQRSPSWTNPRPNL